MSCLVAVVIPLFNKEAEIVRAVKSVLSQSVCAADVVVVDDGSTDRGVERLESLGEARIRIVRQGNRGVSAARNRGVAEVKGDLVAFLDADDEWQPGFLKRVLALRARWPAAGAYGTGVLVADGTGAVRRYRPFGLPKEFKRGLIPNYFKCGRLLSSSSVAVPRDVLGEVGLFREGFGMGEDLDMWFRIALTHSIAFDREPSAIWHRDSENRACRMSRVEQPSALDLSFDVWCAQENRDPMLVGAVTHYMHGYWREAAIQAAAMGDRATASKILNRWKRRLGTDRNWLLLRFWMRGVVTTRRLRARALTNSTRLITWLRGKEGTRGRQPEGRSGARSGPSGGID